MSDYEDQGSWANRPRFFGYRSLCHICHSRGPETGKVCNFCRWEWTDPSDGSRSDAARYRNGSPETYDREWWLTLLSSLVEVDEEYDGPVVYVARGVNTVGPVKIGFTTNPQKRIQALQTSSPTRLEFVKLFQGDRDLEKDLHRYLQSSRLNGEWFDVAGEVSDLLR